MARGLLVFTVLAAFFAPGLRAQTKVCAFQDKPGHAANVSDSDAEALARELNTLSIQTVAAVGISKKDEDAEAQKRGCTWIVTLWREKLPPDTPLYAGSLGGSEKASTMGGSDSAVMGAMTGSPAGGALLEFSLRETGNRKHVAQGESEDASPYTRMAGQIAKKIDKKK